MGKIHFLQSGLLRQFLSILTDNRVEDAYLVVHTDLFGIKDASGVRINLCVAKEIKFLF